MRTKKEGKLTGGYFKSKSARGRNLKPKHRTRYPEPKTLNGESRNKYK